MKLRLFGALSILCLAAACGGAPAAGPRDQILITGSSTVQPFTKAVADRFQPSNAGRPAPQVDATGTGPGIERFCGGIGGDFPDVVGASRRMNSNEFRRCGQNGVGEIVELPLGTDGVVFTHSPSAPVMTLTRRHVYEALAANPYGQPQTKRTWREVDASLPDVPISVYGPPAGDGTRDSLVELIMLPACETNGEMARLKNSDAQRFQQVCSAIRTDGVYTETDENDERTSTLMVVNPRAVGIFGYSFLEKQGDRLRAIAIDGTVPGADTIGNGRYLGSRPLYVYVKKAQVEAVAGLRDYLAELARGAAPGGYLVQAGLIPNAGPAAQQLAQAVSALTPLQGSSLK